MTNLKQIEEAVAKWCKDCKHEHRLEADGFRACPFKKICAANNKNMYQRKRWKFWRPKT